ncbi:hypothetical protein IKQ21_04565 [bacterium]|nr:hypothetical protein [bacterium]
MENLIIDNILLAILIPLWIFLIIMGGRFFSVYVNKFIVYALTILGSLYGAGISLIGLKYVHYAFEWSIPFLRIKDFSLSAGIYADKLALIFAFLLFSISFCIQLFSVSYMKNEEKKYRFFALLNFFNFSMAALVFSPNLYQMYVFWELIGVVSYLLIGFDYSKIQNSDASKKVFLVNRIGDTALISAIIFTTYIIYNYSGNLSFVTLSIPDFNAISTLLAGYTSTSAFLIICGLFILSSVVKSAQYPFHIWLQDAMEAKTPVSALLHSATMVTAGIYLTVRMMPFYSLHSILLKLILLFGIITVIICPILASIETHPKKILAYSTSANLGLVFTAIGLGNIKIAIMLLAAHAFIKSMLFLCLPKDDKTSKFTFLIFVLGGLSLAGIIFAGFPAKDYFYYSLTHRILKYVFLFSTFFSAFYIARLACLIHKNSEFVKTKKLETFSALILLGMNIALYIVLRNPDYKLCYPFISSIIAIITVLILYKFNLLTKIQTVPKIAEFVGYKLTPKLYELFAILLNRIEHNIFCNYKLVTKTFNILVKIAGFMEVGIMDKSVLRLTNWFKSVSKKDSVLQKGNVQAYNGYAMILITTTLIIVTVGYVFICAKFTGGN